MALIESGLVSQLSDDLGYDVKYDGKVHAYGDLMPRKTTPAVPHRNMLTFQPQTTTPTTAA